MSKAKKKEEAPTTARDWSALGFGYRPSEHQEIIYENTMADPTRDFMIQASAGSGKTTVIQGIEKLAGLGDRFMAVAFNAHNAKVFQAKMPSAISSTIHAAAFRAFKSACGYLRFGQDSVDSQKKKMKDIAKKLQLARYYPDVKEEWEVTYGFEAIIHYLMVSLTPPTPEGLEAVVERFSVHTPGADYDLMAEHAAQIMQIAREQAFRESPYAFINFDEMIYYPVMEGFTAPPVHTIVVDEGQDLSNMQRAFVSSIPAERRGMVGDSWQAIMMFAGAENNSMQLFRDTLDDPQDFELPVSWRCGSRIIDHARLLNPSIISPPGQHAGEVTNIETGKLVEAIRGAQGFPFILSRTNAPLVSLLFTLIEQGLRAKMRGKDTGDMLAKTVRVIMGRDTNMSNFEYRVEAYEAAETARIMKNGGNRAANLLGSLNDKLACLSTFNDRLSPSTVDELCRGIQAMFADQEIPGVNLMSAHASKGLETEEVFIINPEKLPLVYRGQSEAQFEQELHLDYVARTRPIQKLTYVLTEPKD